jgi:hypothetical protein
MLTQLMLSNSTIFTDIFGSLVLAMLLLRLISRIMPIRTQLVSLFVSLAFIVAHGLPSL